MLSCDWLKEWELLALGNELKIQARANLSRPQWRRQQPIKFERFLAPVGSEATL